MITKPTTIQIARAMQQLVESPAVPEEQVHQRPAQHVPDGECRRPDPCLPCWPGRDREFPGNHHEDLAEVYEEFDAALEKIKTGDLASVRAGAAGLSRQVREGETPRGDNDLPNQTGQDKELRQATMTKPLWPTTEEE
jgi:hypothetical protein